MYFSYLVICFYSKAYFSNALGYYSTLPDLALAACTCINIVGMMIMVMVMVVMVMVVVVGRRTMVLVFMVVMMVMRRKTFTGVSFASSPDFWPCQIFDTLNRHNKKEEQHTEKDCIQYFLLKIQIPLLCSQHRCQRANQGEHASLRSCSRSA